MKSCDGKLTILLDQQIITQTNTRKLCGNQNQFGSWLTSKRIIKITYL